MTKLASLITPPGANKYELAIVAAREARRLNNALRMRGETESSNAKVTTIALAATLHGDVPFQYVAGRTTDIDAPLPPPVDAE